MRSRLSLILRAPVGRCASSRPRAPPSAPPYGPWPDLLEARPHGREEGHGLGRGPRDELGPRLPVLHLLLLLARWLRMQPDRPLGVVVSPSVTAGVLLQLALRHEVEVLVGLDLQHSLQVMLLVVVLERVPHHPRVGLGGIQHPRRARPRGLHHILAVRMYPASPVHHAVGEGVPEELGRLRRLRERLRHYHADYPRDLAVIARRHHRRRRALELLDLVAGARAVDVDVPR